MKGTILWEGYNISSVKPYIPNPINPKEDFADRWYKNPHLKENFYLWLKQARADFNIINDTEAYTDLSEQIDHAFALKLNQHKFEDDLSKYGIIVGSERFENPSVHISRPSKPWMKE